MRWFKLGIPFFFRCVKLSSPGLSNAQLTEIKKEYQASSFPGLDIPMNQVSEPTISEISYKNRGDDKGSGIFPKNRTFSPLVFRKIFLAPR